MSNLPDRPMVDPATVRPGSAAPTTPAEVRPDDINALQAGQDLSHFINGFLDKWSQQQDGDRKLRSIYAGVLIAILLVQIVAINIAFFQIGLGKLRVDHWTARVFIMSVFGELAAMVFFIVKYLFRATGDDLVKQVGQIAADAVPRSDDKRGGAAMFDAKRGA